MPFDYQKVLDAWDASNAHAQQMYTAIENALGNETLTEHASLVTSVFDGYVAHASSSRPATCTSNEQAKDLLERRICSVVATALEDMPRDDVAYAMCSEKFLQRKGTVYIPEHLAELVACISALAQAQNIQVCIRDIYPRQGALIRCIENAYDSMSTQIVPASKAENASTLVVGLPALASEGTPDYVPAIHTALELLASRDVACLLLPNDFMWSMRSTIRELRADLVSSGIIECVVGLPARCVPRTSTNVCLVVFRKPQCLDETYARPVLMIDARSIGARDDMTQTTRFTPHDITPICELYAAWHLNQELPSCTTVPATIASPTRIERSKYLLAPELYTRGDVVTASPILSLPDKITQLEDAHVLSNNAMGDAHAHLAKNTCLTALRQLAQMLKNTPVVDMTFETRRLCDVLEFVDAGNTKDACSHLAGSGTQDSSTEDVDPHNPADSSYIIVDATAKRALPGEEVYARVAHGIPQLAAGEVPLRVVGDIHPEYLARVIRHTSADGLLVDAYEPARHINLEGFLKSEFVCPPAELSGALEAAFDTCAQFSDALDQAKAFGIDNVAHEYRERYIHKAACVPFDEVALALPGRDILLEQRSEGTVKVISPFGEAGTTNRALTAGSTIIFGARGIAASLAWSAKECWPTGSTVYIDATATEIPLEHLYFSLHAWMDVEGPITINGRESLHDVLMHAKVLPTDAQLIASARSALADSIALEREQQAVHEVIESCLVPLARGNA